MRVKYFYQPLCKIILNVILDMTVKICICFVNRLIRFTDLLSWFKSTDAPLKGAFRRLRLISMAFSPL